MRPSLSAMLRSLLVVLVVATGSIVQSRLEERHPTMYGAKWPPRRCILPSRLFENDAEFCLAISDGQMSPKRRWDTPFPARVHWSAQDYRRCDGSSAWIKHLTALHMSMRDGVMTLIVRG